MPVSLPSWVSALALTNPRRSKVEPYTHLLGKVPDKGTFLYSLTPKGRAAWQEMD